MRKMQVLSERLRFFSSHIFRTRKGVFIKWFLNERVCLGFLFFEKCSALGPLGLLTNVEDGRQKNWA